jgi:hypothetical protein
MALEVEAINPVRLRMFPPNVLYVVARWEVTAASAGPGSGASFST